MTSASGCNCPHCEVPYCKGKNEQQKMTTPITVNGAKFALLSDGVELMPQTPKPDPNVDIVSQVTKARTMAAGDRWDRFVSHFLEIGTQVHGVIDANGLSQEQIEKATKMFKDAGYVVSFSAFAFQTPPERKGVQTDLFHYHVK